MDTVFGRYRNLIILVGVLFLQVLGLAVQVKKSGNDEEKTRLIRIWAVGVVTPMERTLVWVQNTSGGLWHNYFYLRGVRAENRQLKEQIEHMRLEQVRLAEDAAQARRLQTLLAFKEQFISRTVAAQVIGSSGSDHSRIVYIDKGENAGIRRDMAVMTSNGIVGKVLLVYPSVSQVLLINDESSGVGALLEKTRLQGVLRGSANGEIVLERVMSDEQVPVGETVLTSGGDQIFPKGLPVGTVTKVGKGKDLFLNIKIKPAADLSQLEEVLVLVEKEERQPTADDAVRLRASDILAQRLPSVPDKPAAEAHPAAPSRKSSSLSGWQRSRRIWRVRPSQSPPSKMESPAHPRQRPGRPARTHRPRAMSTAPRRRGRQSNQRTRSPQCRRQPMRLGPRPSQRNRRLPRPVRRARSQNRLLHLRHPRPIPNRRLTRISPNSVQITYTSGEQVEVYRFRIPVTVGVPLLALFIQAFVPLRFPRFAVYVDLPLLVTIFFAMARRNPISGLLTGAFIGLAQDMLGHNPIGIYGIAKTVVGYGASSLGVKLDVENAGARFLVTLGFYLVHSAVYFTVARGLVNLTQTWSWPHGILAGLANAFLGVLLYFLLDKFKQRT
jgi:rod shape-determining protein MreC